MEFSGGGTIVGFKSSTVVIVEDEDGFEVPTSIHDVVVIPSAPLGDSHTSEEKKMTAEPVRTAAVKYDEEPGDIRFLSEGLFTGDDLTVSLAYVPADIDCFEDTAFRTYLINRSGYSMHYLCIGSGDDGRSRLRGQGTIPPKAMVFIEEIAKEKLYDIARTTVMIQPYKADGSFALKPQVTYEVRTTPSKFCKRNSFRENALFVTPALIYDIVEKDKVAEPFDAGKYLDEKYSGNDRKDNSPSISHVSGGGKGKQGNAPVVYDLHINELLDTTAGMSAKDILDYQIKYFNDRMLENIRKKGQHLIFIHGKGDGVLRQAVVKELRYKYKTCRFHDASFQEYGFGATEVIVG